MCIFFTSLVFDLSLAGLEILDGQRSYANYPTTPLPQ